MLGLSESCAKFHRNRHTFVVCWLRISTTRVCIIEMYTRARKRLIPKKFAIKRIECYVKWHCKSLWNRKRKKKNQAKGWYSKLYDIEFAFNIGNWIHRNSISLNSCFFEISFAIYLRAIERRSLIRCPMYIWDVIKYRLNLFLCATREVPLRQHRPARLKSALLFQIIWNIDKIG